MEIIERVAALWDAARKSLSLKTRRRIKLLPPSAAASPAQTLTLELQAALVPYGAGSKDFSSYSPVAPGTVWPPGPVCSCAASP